MDLIYMNKDKEDIGVLKDYVLDLAFGTSENDYECSVDVSNNVCKAGFYLYIEGSEYGGIVDTIKVDTESSKLTYKGRTWHGILDSKVLEPDSGTDYLTLTGDANTVLATLISRMGLTSLFKAASASSGININYQMDRYIKGYEGIRKMLKASGAKLNIAFKNGFVELSAKPIVDYSKDEQFDTDQVTFLISKNYRPINHVICLGKGELKDRKVIHVYADESGNISDTQSLTGLNEVTAVYDYANVESSEALKNGGINKIKESWNSDEIRLDLKSNDESYDIGDILGAQERTTGITVNADVTKKIVKIQGNTTTITYKVGE